MTTDFMNGTIEAAHHFGDTVIILEMVRLQEIGVRGRLFIRGTELLHMAGLPTNAAISLDDNGLGAVSLEVTLLLAVEAGDVLEVFPGFQGGELQFLGRNVINLHCVFVPGGGLLGGGLIGGTEHFASLVYATVRLSPVSVVIPGLKGVDGGLLGYDLMEENVEAILLAVEIGDAALEPGGQLVGEIQFLVLFRAVGDAVG
jgi:hypothetical protein